MMKTTMTIAAACALAAGPALADHHSGTAHVAKQTIMPEDEQARAFLEQFGFSEAVIHGDTIYLSGVIAGPPGEGMTEEEAYDRAFGYIGTVLTRAGSGWDDVLDLTTFHVDIEASMPAFAAAKNKVIEAPFPAWTAIDVDRLYSADGLVEIKIVARVSRMAPAQKAMPEGE
ncbi:RidA family protein [Erythrobacter sp. JK5]|uniref:RidA family protein n=1 Tax=Erythrobacter sp. JK5 TaxID=2829500 RepID=UPI001BA72244|nr:RidA family protein [Erythrobacter sp. JK5]QUL37889.1 RidA family protein [Erythrobacter sp. JK5]